MKRIRIIIILILLVMMLSITASIASAAPLGPPPALGGARDHCKKVFSGIFEEETKNCYWKAGPPFPNICYPIWDRAVWMGGHYAFGGCVDLRIFSGKSLQGL